TLVIDGSHGLTASSPRWVLSLGVGTAFASTSLVSPTSPLQRQQTSFAGGVNRGAGSGRPEAALDVGSRGGPRRANLMGMDLPTFTTLVTTLRLSIAVQGTPMDAFRSNIAAIHARDRAAYLSHYLHTPELARVGPDGLRQGYDEFARGAGEGWPDTLVATHLRIVAVSPDVAYGVYRYRVVDTSGSARGVSERVFGRTPAGWKVAVAAA